MTGGPPPARATHPTRPVRPVTAADVSRILQLERALFGRSAWSELMIREELEAPRRWYVAVDGDELVRGDAGLTATSRCVAYAGIWFDGDVAQVMTIAVAPAVQRQGIGALLLDALVRHARELGAEAVLLEVRVDNDPAIALYERFGFTVLGRRKRYYQPEDVDAWTMRLPLR